MFKKLQSKLGLLLILLLVFAFATGCQSYQTQSSGTEVMNIDDMKESMDQREAEHKEQLQSLKDDLDRHYGDGRIYNDYSELSNQLNEMYKVSVENEVFKIRDGVGFVRCNNVYFNDVLEKVLKEEMSLEDVLANPKENIKSLKLEIYTFVESERPFDEDLDLRDKLAYYTKTQRDQLLQNEVRHHEMFIKAYPKSVLEEFPMDVLKTSNDLIRVLRSSKMASQVLYRSKVYKGTAIKKEDFHNVEKELKALYNDDFIAITPLEYIGPDNFICAPEDDLNLRFEYDGLRGDNYLEILMKKELDTKIESILDTNHMNDRMVYLNNPEYMILSETNFKDVTGAELLKNDQLKKKNAMSLYYLKLPDEEIDYDSIVSVVKDIKALNNTNLRNDIWVFFYEVEKTEQEVILKLFKELNPKIWELNPEETLAKLESLYKVDVSNDAFNYLYTHGKEMDYILDIYGPLTTEDPKAFKEEYKRDGLWR